MTGLSWVRKPEAIGTGLSLAGVVLILILHYGSTLRSLGLHDLLRRLFYIPIITAAITGGRRGALLAAGVATAGFVPHLFQLAAAGDRVLDSALELVLLPVVGLLVGGFADSSRRARIMAAERGRLAALGEVATVLIAQVEGPLASIGGQTESLRFLAEQTRSRALGFAAEIIHQELARTRRFLLDLIEIGRPAKRNVTRVNVSALLDGIAQEIHASSAGGDRLALAEMPKHILVEANRGVLCYALRSLLSGLLDAVPRSGRIRVGISEEIDGAVIAVTAISDLEDLPDIERSLSAVFGAGTDEYNFRHALCVHLLRAEGASLGFRRVSDREATVRVRFRRVGSERRPARSRPTFREAEAWVGSGGGRS